MIQFIFPINLLWVLMKNGLKGTIFDSIENKMLLQKSRPRIMIYVWVMVVERKGKVETCFGSRIKCGQYMSLDG